MEDHLVGSSPFRNVLLLTDFSACSDTAFVWATELSRANDAMLSVLHVVVPDTLTYMTPDSPAAALETQETWAREQMRRVEASLARLHHETAVVIGSDLWPAVEPRARQLGTDLIVLGTHGRTGLRRLLTGSVAEEVLRKAPCPVLALRTPAP